MHGHGCPMCKFEKIQFNNLKRSEECKNDFEKKSIKIHGNEFDYSKVKYVNAITKVCIICHEHGEFWQTPNSHLRGNGCPKCKSSHLETEIRNFLTENNIKFKEQYRTQWLGLQSLDFYLPDYKVGIECQGGQHFFTTGYFANKEKFQRTNVCDKRKLQKCKDNGVKLLYYSNLGIEYPYEVFEDKGKLLETIFEKI